MESVLLAAKEVAWTDKDLFDAAFTVAGWVVAAILAVVAILTYLRSRRDSTHQALTEVLQPFVAAMRHLFDAHHCRKQAEELKQAFPDPNVTPEAAERINSKIDEYNRMIDLASQECRIFEREFATRHFRFPDNVSRLLQSARNDLFKAGTLVNKGMFEPADVQFAALRDHYNGIARYARGWRPLDPVRNVYKRITTLTKKKQPELPEFELTDHEMVRIMALVHKRVTTQATNTYVVHPPRKLIEDPDICNADNVVDQLKDDIFEVVFQDCTF